MANQFTQTGNVSIGSSGGLNPTYNINIPAYSPVDQTIMAIEVAATSGSWQAAPTGSIVNTRAIVVTNEGTASVKLASNSSGTVGFFPVLLPGDAVTMTFSGTGSVPLYYQSTVSGSSVWITAGVSPAEQIMTISPDSGLENGFKAYLQSVNIPYVGQSVYRNTDQTPPSTPLAVFTIAGEGREKEPNSGIYNIPMAIRVVMNAGDLKANTGSLDSITTYVINSLSGSMSYINTNSNDIYIFGLIQPRIPQATVIEAMFVKGIDFEAVCKSR